MYRGTFFPSVVFVFLYFLSFSFVFVFQGVDKGGEASIIVGVIRVFPTERDVFPLSVVFVFVFIFDYSYTLFTTTNKSAAK